METLTIRKASIAEITEALQKAVNVGQAIFKVSRKSGVWCLQIIKRG